MRAHRILWRSICVLLGLTGTAVTLTISPSMVAVLFIFLGVLGILGTLCLSDAYSEQNISGRLRLLTGGALLPGVSGAAFVGYASLIGPGVFLLAAAVFAGSPYAVANSSRWLRSVRTPSAAQLDAVARALSYASPESARLRAPGLQDLTDEQLCKRWRASYRAARRQSSPVKLIAGLAERQVYLDELERRNETGFAAWLAAGPHAAEDPLPYLAGDVTPDPPLDWDELIRGQG
jgi:hypothetical protein